MRNEDFTGQGLMESAYSYERPAYIVGNALLNGMIAAGLTKEQAIQVLHSKHYRWSLDQDLGELLTHLAYSYGFKMAKQAEHEDWINDPLPDDLQNALDRHNEIENGVNHA